MTKGGSEMKDTITLKEWAAEIHAITSALCDLVNEIGDKHGAGKDELVKDFLKKAADAGDAEAKALLMLDERISLLSLRLGPARSLMGTAAESR
jgi:hypothetical protein